MHIPAQPNFIPIISPTHPPTFHSITQRAAWLLDRLPGRGVLHLLDPQLTRADRPPLAVIIAEQYMLDVLKYWEDDRVECAVRLARGRWWCRCCVRIGDDVFVHMGVFLLCVSACVFV